MSQKTEAAAQALLDATRSCKHARAACMAAPSHDAVVYPAYLRAANIMLDAAEQFKKAFDNEPRAPWPLTCSALADTMLGFGRTSPSYTDDAGVWAKKAWEIYRTTRDEVAVRTRERKARGRPALTEACRAKKAAEALAASEARIAARQAAREAAELARAKKSEQRNAEYAVAKAARASALPPSQAMLDAQAALDAHRARCREQNAKIQAYYLRAKVITADLTKALALATEQNMAPPVAIDGTQHDT